MLATPAKLPADIAADDTLTRVLLTPASEVLTLVTVLAVVLSDVATLVTPD